MLQKLTETVDYIQSHTSIRPRVAIILGSGLGDLANDIEVENKIVYRDIPNFPVSTVKGHNGQLIFGVLSGVEVVAMQGRFHFYEGYSMQEVTFPERVFKQLGVEYLFVSNASGGTNPNFKVGDIMFIKDHINLMPNPLIGHNEDELGPRFVDMSEAYDRELLKKAMRVADKHNISYKTGVYAGLTGPSYETPSEYNYVRILGGDAVGMSTVPEVIVARHMNLPVFAVSVISDLGGLDNVAAVSHKEVLAAVEKVTPKLIVIIKDLLKEL